METAGKMNEEMIEYTDKRIEEAKSWNKKLSDYAAFLDEIFPYIFVVSYLDSMVCLILQGGCRSGFGWLCSSVNLFAVLFWVYRRSSAKKIIERREFIIGELEKVRQKLYLGIEEAKGIEKENSNKGGLK
jgi:hypothetical protein